MSAAVILAFTVGLCVGVLSCAAVALAILAEIRSILDAIREEPLP